MINFAKIGQKEDKERQNKHLMCSTIVENVLQIGLFLQNKANLCRAKFYASSLVASK